MNLEAGAPFAFAKHEKLLFGVLSHLTRDGYAVLPTDARDLLHDFYVDAWSGLGRNYNPAFGSEAAYVAGAFYRFARRRILRQRNWQARLVDLADVPEPPAPAADPGDHVEAGNAVRYIRQAMSRLPFQERQVLQNYFEEDSPSLRTIAARYGLSRYAVRESLINALGRIATDLGQTMPPGTAEAKVAQHLWVDGRTVRSTAVLLGLPAAQIQDIKASMVAGLIDALGDNKKPTVERSLAMNDPLAEKRLWAKGLLKEFVVNPESEQLLSSIMEQAKDIGELLDEEDMEFTSEEIASLESNHNALATLYVALMKSGGVVDESELDGTLQAIRDDEDGEIGQAFSALCEGLPAELRDWSLFFTAPTDLDEMYEHHLRQEVSVINGGPDAWELVRFGMSPVTVAEVLSNLQLLADDIYWEAAEAGIEAKPLALVLPADEIAGADPVTQQALFLLRGVPSLPRESVEEMLTWIIQVARCRPLLVAGYEALPTSSGIALQPVDGSVAQRPLMVRWTTERIPNVREHEQRREEPQRFSKRVKLRQ